MARLFSSHDPYHVHAVLGLVCLASFVYSYTTMSVMAVQWVPHVLLSCSSLVFSVPSKRIARNPTIIYQEYRLHAIVFTFRSLLIYLASYEHRAMRLIIVLGASAVADLISREVGDPRQTTVRGNGQARDKRVKVLIKLYSSYQIIASAAHIAGQDAPFNGFTTLISIQSSAFLMTLVKKGKIKWYTHAVLYTLALLLSVSTLEFGTATVWMVAGCVLARVGAGINKYALWIAFSFLC